MFRNIRKPFASLLFIVMLLPFSARAELSIAVVDVDYVLTQSSAAKSLKKQVEDKRKKFIGEVKSEEESLIAEQKKIEGQRKDISQEDLIKKAQGFEKKRIEARKKIQTRKNGLDKAYGEAMSNLTKVIYEVCQTIADEKGIDLVITRQNIIVGNMSLDITKEVASRMNKKLPNVTLNVK
ncbi:MAG: OmpH family outer membrane protein [Alphaproteobacteria bacterium]